MLDDKAHSQAPEIWSHIADLSWDGTVEQVDVELPKESVQGTPLGELQRLQAEEVPNF